MDVVRIDNCCTIRGFLAVVQSCMRDLTGELQPQTQAAVVL